MTGFRAGARLALVVSMTALAAPPALAQAEAPARASVLQNLLDCRAVSEDAARLACYDRAAGVIDQAEAKGDIVVVDREQARTVRRQAFGFALPSMSLFSRGEPTEEIDEITATLAQARQGGDGKWTVRLQDGAVWQQIDTNPLHRTPRPGMEVEIRQASMGSFLISIDGMRAFRARRVE